MRNLNQKANPNLKSLMFFALILGLFFLLGMQNYISLRPQGPHQWRQADCLSFTLNYSVQDNGLFEPELHNLMSDGGESGKSAGEFPLLYYFIGKIWKVTGQQEWIYRLINFSIFVLGLYALFLIVFRETKSILASLLLAGLIFSIPVLSYYSANFLSNITALSFVFMGWYFAYRFYQEQKWHHVLLALVFFTLAPLLKITALISILALFGTLGIHLISGGLVFKKPISKLTIVASVVGALVILASSYFWYSYSRRYNTMHGGWFTFNDLWPIWQVTSDYLKETASDVFAVWLWEYYSPAAYFFLILSLIVFVVRFKHISRFARWMVLFLFIGNFSYIMLWFKALKEHDYYVINLYVLPILLWIIALVELKKVLVKSGMTKKLALVVTVCLLGTSTVHGFRHLKNRYEGWFNDHGKNPHASFFDITPYLRNELNIKRDVPVVTYPDPSYCITLYLADQKGWPMNRTRDVAFIKSRIDEGAKYILVNDSSFYRIQDLGELNLKKVGMHKNISVLKILD